MKSILVLSLLVALTQSQSPRKLDYTEYLSGVKSQLTSLAKRPMLLSGGSNDRQTLKEAQDVASTAKKLFVKTNKKLSAHIGEATARDGGRLQIIIEKLSALSPKINGDDLSADEKKLNHMISQGLQHEATQAMSKLQGRIMNTLSQETAPAAAKLLLSQVMTKQLKEMTQKQAKKLTNTVIHDEGEGFLNRGPVNKLASMNAPPPDAEGVDDDEGVSDVADPDTNDGVADEADPTIQGVDDELPPSKLQGNIGGGSKKTMCMLLVNKEFCVTQEKAL
ncbi:uncharacterized protein LOC125237167 isoform X2 [Leguminivora glycinivorella]|uniref:uncharacterized protein LOC125237167 isoform X2 n=1 Tax=Leguminivora glycinivorella TaxID=1035111 RepID=UPI00200E8482|nr:uncharacterized protein LOC125237167 isoform X2 [Leguminivora glycinivorella]